MTDKRDLRLKFYDIIKTLKEQITELLADNSLPLEPRQRREHIRRLENMYDKLMLAKSTNSRLAIELFYQHVVVPYGHHILSRNEQFFLSTSVDCDPNDLPADVQVDVLVAEIRKIWNMLDENNKNVIWRYILALSKVCDMIVGEGHLDQVKKSLSS